MYENIFHDLIEIKQNKIIEETKKAADNYKKMKESNPSMLTYSNTSPNSYTGYYNNPYTNPNIIPPNNPYVYNRPTFGTWYGSYSTYDYTSNFMIASDEEIKNGKNTRGRVTIDNEIINETENHISYEDKTSGKYLKVNIKEIVEDTINVNHENIKEVYGIKYIEKKIKPKDHIPNTPFTVDELKQNTIKILLNTPLIWTKDDENELSKLADMVAVYDKALAHIIWNIPCNTNSISREEYNYCKIYCRNLIQEYMSEEIIHSNINFKAPYRYRELPETYLNGENEIVDMSKPYPYAKLAISIYTNELDYEYDRGRDELTEDEWNLFLDRAYIELMNGIKRLQEKDFVKINEQLIDQPTKQNNSSQLPNYNPYDPISMKLYNMKQAENGYNTNMEFFRYALRHKFSSNEQFDNWWYGTKSQADFVKNQRNPEYYRNYQESSWKRQMTEQNINNLSRFVPLDNQEVANQYNQRAYKEINKFTNGSLSSNMKMSDVVNNLSYLDNRIHEMNVEENINNYKNSFVYNNGQSIINKNMFNHMLYEFHNNDNPNYVSTYGPTIDPRMGVPDIVYDYTQPYQENYKARYQRFLDACHKMQEFPLSPAGVLK